MAKKKVDKGFYPIYAKDFRRLMGYCKTWHYGNKDTCKYVAEQTAERLKEQGFDVDYFTICSEIIGIVHDMNNGGSYKRRPILIPIKEGK